MDESPRVHALASVLDPDWLTLGPDLETSVCDDVAPGYVVDSYTPQAFSRTTSFPDGVFSAGNSILFDDDVLRGK